MKQKGVKELVFFLLILIIFLFSLNFTSSAMAGGNVTLSKGPALIRYGNYTTTINVSIVTSMINTSTNYNSNYNATLFCNYSGGAVTKSEADVGIIKIVTLYNGTNGNSLVGNKIAVLENASVRISTIAFANQSTIFNCSIWAENTTDQNWSLGNALYNPSNLSNLTFDSTPPNVSFSGITNTVNYGNYTASVLVINVSVIDALMGISTVYFNITFSNGTQVNYTKAINSGNYYNITIDTTNFQDEKYNITVYTNDTQLNNFNKTEWIYVIFDKTNPTGALSCSPSTAYEGDAVTCNCAGTDATSGISTYGFPASPSTSQTGTFTPQCTITDYAGNYVTVSTTYSVETRGSGGGGGGIVVKPVNKTADIVPDSGINKTQSWTKITPGVVEIMKDFDSEIGIKEIRIEVQNSVNNIEINVIKYDAKPASVSVSKSGTYKYLQIKEENIGQNLDKATVKIQVKKSWASANNLNKEDMALFRYDESLNEWNELPTTFAEEDDTYYSYNVELTHFSYFAIAEKEIPGEKTSLVWVIVIIAVLVVSFGIWFFLGKKKKRK